MGAGAPERCRIFRTRNRRDRADARRDRTRTTRLRYERASELQYGILVEQRRRLAKSEQATSADAGQTASCSKKRSTLRISPRSSRAGLASRCRRLLEGELETAPHGGSPCTSGSSVRTKPSLPSPMRFGARARVCQIRTGRSDHSSSSGRPASARPNWPERWRNSCSMTIRR